MIKKTLAFSNPAYLSLRDCQMVIKFPEKDNSASKREQTSSLDLPSESRVGKAKAGSGSRLAEGREERTIPIEDIGVVVIEHKQVTITHALISALVENNCALITCDNNMLPSGLLLPLSVNTVQQERFTDQITASLPLKKQLWQQTVQYKIRNQAAVLQKLHDMPCKNMLIWANDVRSGDADNKEARAAAYYWKNIFPTIPKFIRGREEEPPNNLLNYGYAILRAVIARALVSSGMLPTLGIHHHNRYNAYCLANDIMEPYRPYVDLLVYKLVASGTSYEEITPAIKRELLQIPTIDVVINGKRSPLMVAASTTTASLYRCFSGELRKILYPEM